MTIVRTAYRHKRPRKQLPATPFARQLLRDEDQPRIKRIIALTEQVAGCIEAGLHDAAITMQFVELDAWAYLCRPATMTKHGRASFKWFIKTYLRGDPTQEYQYDPEDAYAARCGMLHTFGSLSDLHGAPKGPVIWRFHLGQNHTFVQGLKKMAYISVRRFCDDAQAATNRCLGELKADEDRSRLFGDRLPRMFLHSGMLQSRDADAIAALDPEIDRKIAVLDSELDSDEPIHVAGHTMVRGRCVK